MISPECYRSQCTELIALPSAGTQPHTHGHVRPTPSWRTGSSADPRWRGAWSPLSQVSARPAPHFPPGSPTRRRPFLARRRPSLAGRPPPGAAPPARTSRTRRPPARLDAPPARTSRRAGRPPRRRAARPSERTTSGVHGIGRPGCFECGKGLTIRFARKIYSGETRNRVLIGIAFQESAGTAAGTTGGSFAGNSVAELAKEDEIPQRSVITAPTRREVIAADAKHPGHPLAARRRTDQAGDGRHQN